MTPITTHPDILWQLPADRPPGQHSTSSCLTIWPSDTWPFDHLIIWQLTSDIRPSDYRGSNIFTGLDPNACCPNKILAGIWRLWSSDSKVGDILTGHVTSNLPWTCLILDFTFFHQDIICLLEICGKYHKKFNMKQAGSNKLSLFVNILTIYVNGISIIFGKLWPLCWTQILVFNQLVNISCVLACK